MITKEEKEGWHYLAVKKKNSKHKGDFCCLNCLNFFRTENQLKSHKIVHKNKDFCGIVMPSKRKKY